MARSSKGGHILNSKDQSAGGKKSRRGPARSTSILKMLEAKPSKSLVAAIKKQMNSHTTDSGDMLAEKQIATFADMLDTVLMYEALSGNVTAHKEINDRCDGKAPQAVEHTGKDGGPVQVIISSDMEDF